MEDISGTAASGVPARKHGCRNEVDSEGVCTHSHTLIKENFASVVQRGPGTTRGIEAFLQ